MANENPNEPVQPTTLNWLQETIGGVHTAITFARFGEYGTLNPAIRPVQEKVDLSTATFESAVKKAVIESARPNILANQHIFKAIVLYAWKPLGPSTEGFLKLFPEITNMTHVKARIPELHMQPQPISLPLNNNPDHPNADWLAINAHPTFVAKDTLVSQYSLPQPGEVIYVTFESFDPFAGPIYLGKVNETHQLAYNIATLEPPVIEPVEFRSASTTVKFEPAGPHGYKQNRVRLYAFGNAFKEISEHLRDFPTKNNPPGKVKLHKLMVDRLNAMNEAWMSRPGRKPADEPFKAKGYGAGTRKDKYNSDVNAFFKNIVEKYKGRMLVDGKDYGDTAYNNIPRNAKVKIFKKKRPLSALHSPHETGLAIDFGNNGITTNSDHQAKHRLTEGWQWLKANAHLYGITHLSNETWHWECLIPRESWKSGEEFATPANGVPLLPNGKPNYAIRVIETFNHPMTENKTVKYQPTDAGGEVVWFQSWGNQESGSPNHPQGLLTFCVRWYSTSRVARSLSCCN